MALRPWIYALPSVIGLGAAVWLYRENRALEQELAEVQASAASPAPAAKSAAPSQGTGEADRAGRSGGLGGLLRGLGSARERPSLPEPEQESRGERRRRRMDELRAMLGRDPGESADDYRARVIPMITAALVMPRARMEDARREAEKAAGVTSEQRAQIDKLFDDVMRETLEHTNQAITAGDLTPYERNLSGLLSWGGGLGAILGTTQTQLGGILSADQRQIIADQGFEWGEYLSARVPWEQLQPPPAPGVGDDGGGS